MKRIILSIVALSMFSFLYAENKGWYMGYNYHQGNGVHTYRGDLSHEANVDSQGHMLKFGHDKHFYKIEISYFNNNLDYGSKRSTINGLDFDVIAMFPNYTLRPYIGVGVGMHYWQNFILNERDSSGSDTGETRGLEGGSYNFFTGMTFQYEKLELDLGYKYKTYFWESISINSDSSKILDQETNINYIYFGINYKL